MTPEERTIFTELRKEVKKANQRLVRLEKETKQKGSFAAKQLYDDLSTKEMQLITPKGRIRYSEKLNLEELKVMQKAINKFLKSESTIAKIKEKKLKYEAEIKEEMRTIKSLDWAMVNTIFQSGKHYTWIYEYIPKSEFWGYWVNLCNDENWSVNKWINEILERIDKIPDIDLKLDLTSLYYYIKED